MINRQLNDYLIYKTKVRKLTGPSNWTETPKEFALLYTMIICAIKNNWLYEFSQNCLH